MRIGAKRMEGIATDKETGYANVWQFALL
jgi:hypothetical protein